MFIHESRVFDASGLAVALESGTNTFQAPICGFDFVFEHNIQPNTKIETPSMCMAETIHSFVWSLLVCSIFGIFLVTLADQCCVAHFHAKLGAP